MKRQTAKSKLGQFSPKWALVIVCLLIGYAILQPAANRQLGWQLPSLISLLEQSAPPAGDDRGIATDAEQITKRNGDGDTTDATAADRSDSGDRQQDSGKGRGAEPGAAELTYDYLKAIAPGDYLSPAGLRYTPMGGEEKHRLDHIMRHLVDDSSRPVHGVFDGDMPQVLRWIDDAYQRAQTNSKDVVKKHEDGRDVIDVRFSKPIGYVGGQKGKREGFPAARGIRLVLEGKRVISAFPTSL
ncbi:MAG: hypothetical protein KDB22_20630 [Planctomycetales bacterium]|nr:hypothetical protein [Planctomycetales bacterium]